MFKNILKKDLLNVLMVKLQTIDILGHTRLSFFSWHGICPEIRQMHTMSYQRPSITRRDTPIETAFDVITPPISRGRGGSS